MDCSLETPGDNRLPRTLAKGQEGEILDRLEIFNSVEVLAPSIELDDLRNGLSETQTGKLKHVMNNDQGNSVNTFLVFLLFDVIFVCYRSVNHVHTYCKYMVVYVKYIFLHTTFFLCTHVVNTFSFEPHYLKLEYYESLNSILLLPPIICAYLRAMKCCM